MNNYLFLNFAVINSTTNRIYIYKQYIALIENIFSSKLNFEIYIIDYFFQQYNRNIFVKTIDNLYFEINSILLIELKFVEKYKYKILSNLFLVICYILEQVKINS